MAYPDHTANIFGHTRRQTTQLQYMPCLVGDTEEELTVVNDLRGVECKMY